VDFPDEGYHFLASANVAEAIDAICGRTAALLANARRGRLIREGAQVAIVGMPNVGKSSLFNALVGTARAIVTEYPGTTRDLVSETVDLDGLRVTLVDSAGIRETSDPVEAEGVARSHGAARVADLRVLVCDRSVPEQERALEGFLAREAGGPTLVVANKADLPAAWSRDDAVEVSATTGFGLDAVRSAIVRALDVEPLRDRPEISNMRHVELVARADAALRQARQAASSDGLALSEEFVLADLQRARGALEEITGRRTTDELLAHIFSAFCIGK
jgi:tRNA modification GTPase